MYEDEGHDDRFEWDDFNLESAQRHGVSWIEIEDAVDNEPYVDRTSAAGITPFLREP